jgi:PqqD family protein of HPr-rel-A system
MTASAPRPKATAGYQETDIGDEYLFYDAATDLVHVLNASAREIYLLCDGSRTEDEIVSEFAARYPTDESTARRDAQQVLGRLHQLGMLSSS